MSSLNRDSSWVVISKETGKAIFETFNPKLVNAINLEKYEVVPILKYLQDLNRAIKAEAK